MSLILPIRLNTYYDTNSIVVRILMNNSNHNS